MTTRGTRRYPPIPSLQRSAVAAAAVLAPPLVAAAVLSLRGPIRKRRARGMAAEEHDEIRQRIADELCTPLTSVVGYLELVTDGSLGSLAEGQQLALDTATRNADQLSVVVDMLLETTLDPVT